MKTLSTHLKPGDIVKILDGSGCSDYCEGWANGMNSFVGYAAVVKSEACPGEFTLYDIPYVWDSRYLLRLNLPCPQQKFPYPKRILRTKGATIVFWEDGTKTVVKPMEDTQRSDYDAFTAALAKKIYGTNSAVCRIVAKTEVGEK